MFGNSEILVREGNRVGDHPKSMGATIMLTNVVLTSSSRNFYLAPALDITPLFVIISLVYLNIKLVAHGESWFHFSFERFFK